MTYPDAFAADRWTLPTWDVDLRARRLSDWIEDPLERALLIAVVLVGAVLLLVVSSQDATGTTPWDACVDATAAQARAFAQVMGDDRAISTSFAARSCEQRLA